MIKPKMSCNKQRIRSLICMLTISMSGSCGRRIGRLMIDYLPTESSLSPPTTPAKTSIVLSEAFLLIVSASTRFSIVLDWSC